MRLPTLAALCLAASPLAAQDTQVTNGQAFGDWRVNCTAQGPGQTACLLGQQILRSEDRALVAQIVALQTDEGEKTFLSARVPVGAYFPAGFAMRAEEGGDVIQFVWQSCTNTLCEALAEIPTESLTALSADGQTVLGSYRPNIRAENVIFRFSLAGVFDGLNALRAAQAK